jgi:8-oxo-dGTP diphosphatase
MALLEFTVAGALVESGTGLLLVCNRRRNGTTDWTTPGGVIDATDATLLDGLTREVEEETGLLVTGWEGPLYEVRAVAVDLGWTMRCEVYRALEYEGDLWVDDPDGIVIDAMFADHVECGEILASCVPWVGEPITEWLEHRWGAHEPRRFSYELSGGDRGALRAVRV